MLSAEQNDLITRAGHGCRDTATALLAACRPRGRAFDIPRIFALMQRPLYWGPELF